MSKAATLAVIGARQWRVIYDQTLTASGNGFTVALPPEFEQFRGILDFKAVAGAGTPNGSNPYTSFRISKDGGSTFLAGASDYLWLGYYSTSGTRNGIGASYTTNGVLATRSNNVYPEISSRADFTFRNKTGCYLLGNSKFSAYGADGTSWSEGRSIMLVNQAAKATHMQFGSGDVGGNQFAAGSRLILEAYQ